MPDYCTCGAQLLPDSLFCHKCGKPQREIPTVEPLDEAPEAVPAPAPAPAAAPPQALPVSFRNPVLLRISLLVSVGATVLMFLPFINWIAGGFFSVFFYRRKTGFALTVGSGVRMGWITGILMFGLWIIGFVVEQVPAALSGKLEQALLENMRSWAMTDPAAQQQLVAFLQSGPGLTMVALFSLVVITGLSMAGGALGAKLVGRGN
jgi:hypothetical protein